MIHVHEHINWAFWVSLTLLSGWGWTRSFLGKRLYWPFMATILGVFTCFLVLLAVRTAYAAPLALIQDIAAAHQALRSQPLPTTEIGPLVREVLAEEQRPAPLRDVWPRLAATWPGLEKQEQQEYDKIAVDIKVQAHPPFATMFVTPFVYLFGVYGTSLAISLLSIACTLAILALLYRGLQLDLFISQRMVFSSALVGWYPMFEMLSHGQWGALLSLLVVIGWYACRKDLPMVGGIAVGLATSLKLFPGLLLVYFLLRHRKAFWFGVGTVILVNAATMSVFGIQSYIDYMNTARFVAGNWGHNAANWSLLGTMGRVLDQLHLPSSYARAAFLGIATVLVAAISLSVLSRPRSVWRFDLEYSLFVVAMTLLSPTCWSHYFVVLLLPLAVLANRALRAGETSKLLFLVLFLVLAVPDSFTSVVLPFVKGHLGSEAGLALHVLPSLALMGMMTWLAVLARSVFERDVSRGETEVSLQGS